MKDLHDEISRRACVFTEDNLPSFQERMRDGSSQMFIDEYFVQLIKAAMNIGASIVIEKSLELLNRSHDIQGSTPSDLKF